MSATTPTTVSHSPRSLKRTRRPSASPRPPGKYSRTMRSLTIATFGASAVSRVVNSRPASSELRLRLTLDPEVAADEHPPERCRVDQARGLYAGQMLDALEHSACER